MASLPLTALLLAMVMVAGGAAWQQYAPVPTADDLRSIAADPAAGFVVALSLNHAVVSDDNGDTWTVHALGVPTTSFAHATICFAQSSAGSYFLAVVDSVVLHSADGRNYTNVLRADVQLLGVHCSVGCAAPGVCDKHYAFSATHTFSSTDGTTWAREDLSLQGNSPTAIASAAMRAPPAAIMSYVAGGDDISPQGTGAIFARQSGGVWTACTLAQVARPPTFLGLAASAHEVVAVGYSGIVAVAALGSTRFTLYLINATMPSISGPLLAVGAYDGTFYILVDGARVLTSATPSSPSSWTLLHGPPAASFAAITESRGVFTLAGNSGSLVRMTTDASFRTLSNVVTTGDFDNIAVGSVAVAGAGSAAIAVLGTVCGEENTVYVSFDGSQWARQVSAVDVHNVDYAGAVWFGVRGGGAGDDTLAASLDGHAWRVVLQQRVLSPVVYADDRARYSCVAADQESLVVWTSKDGTAWASEGPLVVAGVRAPQLSRFAAYGSGTYALFITYFDYAMNMSRTGLAVSRNGAAYTLVQQFGQYTQFYPVALSFVKDWQLFLLAVDHSVFSSSDAATWVEHKLPSGAAAIVAAAQCGSHVLAVLADGTFLGATRGLDDWAPVYKAPGLAVYPTVSLVCLQGAWVVAAGRGGVYGGRL